MKFLGYFGTLALVVAMILKEGFSIEETEFTQWIVIVAFNLGAAGLFILAGFMVGRKKGHDWILAFGILARLWTFFHIYILYAEVELFDSVTMLEMEFLNFVLVGFEAATFFIASPGDERRDLRDERDAYRVFYQIIKKEFAEVTQRPQEHLDLYAKRIGKEIRAKIRTETVNSTAAKVIKVPSAPQKPKPAPKPKAQSDNKISEEEARRVFHKFTETQNRAPSSRELAALWNCSNATALKWAKNWELLPYEEELV